MAKHAPKKPTPRGGALCSIVLLALLLLFCLTTEGGRTYAKFAARSWETWHKGRGLTADQKRLSLYDATYPLLLYLREYTPSEAVILLPPRQFVMDRSGGSVPLLASPSSTYNFIYPRVPVHFGDDSPMKDCITHLLVWEHWGLELLESDVAATPQNRIGLHAWPEGKGAPW